MLEHIADENKSFVVAVVKMMTQNLKKANVHNMSMVKKNIIP
jgi:hypothetical protein